MKLSPKYQYYTKKNTNFRRRKMTKTQLTPCSSPNHSSSVQIPARVHPNEDGRPQRWTFLLVMRRSLLPSGRLLSRHRLLNRKSPSRRGLEVAHERTPLLHRHLKKPRKRLRSECKSGRRHLRLHNLPRHLKLPPSPHVWGGRCDPLVASI
jgi:hypothetical protein